MAEGGVQTSLTCSVCFEDFQTPKVLPCGHTFCFSCIMKMIPYGHGYTLNCPKCRRIIDLPNSGSIEDLPTNFELLNLIDEQKHKRDCVETDGVPGRQILCGVHKGVAAELYCKTCSKPVCVKCILGDHKFSKHDLISREDYINEQKNCIMKYKNQLPHVSDLVNQIDDTVSKAEVAFQNEKKKLVSAVKKHKNQQCKKINQAAANVLKEIETKAKESERGCKVLRGGQRRLGERLQRMQDRVTKTCEDLSESKNVGDEEIESICRKVDKLVLKVEAFNVASRTTPTAIDMNFVASYDGNFGKLNPVRELTEQERSMYDYLTKYRPIYAFDSEDEEPSKGLCDY